MFGEGQLVETAVGATELSGQFTRQRQSVKLFRVFGRMGLGGAALNELAFTCLDRSQLVIAF